MIIPQRFENTVTTRFLLIAKGEKKCVVLLNKFLLIYFMHKTVSNCFLTFYQTAKCTNSPAPKVLNSRWPYSVLACILNIAHSFSLSFTSVSVGTSIQLPFLQSTSLADSWAPITHIHTHAQVDRWSAEHTLAFYHSCLLSSSCDLPQFQKPI